MSRSRKKTPYITQERKDANYSNRVFRHNKLAESHKGGHYRKSQKGGWKAAYWYSLENAKREYFARSYVNEHYSLDEWLENWKKWVVRK